MNGQKAYEKMLKVTNPLGNANQNQNEVLLHTCQDAIIEKTKDNKDVKNWNNAHYLWECKMVYCCEKHYGSPSKKLKIELPYDLVILLVGIIQNN